MRQCKDDRAFKHLVPCMTRDGGPHGRQYEAGALPVDGLQELGIRQWRGRVARFIVGWAGSFISRTLHYKVCPRQSSFALGKVHSAPKSIGSHAQ